MAEAAKMNGVACSAADAPFVAPGAYCVDFRVDLDARCLRGVEYKCFVGLGEMVENARTCDGEYMVGLTH